MKFSPKIKKNKTVVQCLLQQLMNKYVQTSLLMKQDKINTTTDNKYVRSTIHNNE